MSTNDGGRIPWDEFPEIHFSGLGGAEFMTWDEYEIWQKSIKSKWPEPKQGKCEWCERHNQTLYWTIGVTDGELWSVWICEKCRSCVGPLHRVLNGIKEGEHDDT